MATHRPLVLISGQLAELPLTDTLVNLPVAPMDKDYGVITDALPDMRTQIQFRRGTTAQTSSFTGAVGEITVDTDKKTLVVHDGLTPGGNTFIGVETAMTYFMS
jgi:hypothetical protein